MIRLDKGILKKHRVFNTLLLTIAFLLTVFCIVTGSYIQDKENVQVGSIARERYVSPKDAVDEAATERLKKEAMETVGPLYKHDTEVQNNSIIEINDFFDDLNIILASVDTEENLSQNIKDAVLKIPVAFTDKQCTAYYHLSEGQKQQFEKDVIEIANFVYDQGVTEDSKDKALTLVSDGFTQKAWNNDLSSMGKLIVSAILKPNLVLDEENIQAAKEKKAAEVPNVMIKKYQKIVDQGELITQDIYDKLEALNLINQDYSENFIPILGSITVVLLLFIVTSLYFITQQKKIMLKANEMLMLFTIYMIMIVILRLTSKITNFALIPIALFAILVSMLISTRVAIILNFFVGIVAIFISNGDMESLLYFLISGTFAAIFMQFTEKRSRIVLISLSMGIVNFTTIFAGGIFFENGYSQALIQNGIYAAIIGIISIIIAIGSLPFWEAAFEANTPVRLLELTNPNNELLRRLMIEAPGTYHHSLIVANLAERAAFDVEANPMLARVGAYYHDIGKMKYPLYFSENQVGENPHDNLEPYSSAKIITQHVKSGLEMGNEKGLPKVILSIIGEHHGTTLVKFFYYKAMKQYEKEEVNEKDFRYDGPIPQSKEAAIVMLADTVEAAVRSTLSNGKNMSEVGQLIETLIKDKFNDGQLNDSGLKIKDLETIKNSFMRVFHGMYHDRIAYPKQEEIQKAVTQHKAVKEEKEEKKKE